jgi:hypothetical protein
MAGEGSRPRRTVLWTIYQPYASLKLVGMLFGRERRGYKKKKTEFLSHPMSSFVNADD